MKDRAILFLVIFLAIVAGMLATGWIEMKMAASKVQAAIDNAPAAPDPADAA